MKMGPNYLLSHFESRNFAERTWKKSVEQKREKIKYIFLNESKWLNTFVNINVYL